jgi:hypothetical protein
MDNGKEWREYKGKREKRKAGDGYQAPRAGKENQALFLLPETWHPIPVPHSLISS